MPKTLIIAEKPSVATDLSKVLAKKLGKFEKKKDYFENDQAIISSAIGHLVELKMPTTPEGKKLPWGFKHLPHIPEKFILQPIERNESRFKLLKRLMNKKDVDTIINACDAGREGELIFRYLLDEAGVTGKKIQRLWMQSMTNDAIFAAFDKLRDGDELQPLADAAICRSESDWLIGLNGTRALTAYNSRNGGFNVTTAGRVQTPTLAILAEREVEIRSFVSDDYWEVHGDFKVEAGNYAGRWFREDFKKDPAKEHGRAERIWTSEEAHIIRDRCEGKEGIVEEKKKPTKQGAPQLYDLTTLQREAGSRFGFSAKRTLQLAQALYDRYKLLTYPRTDSRYLPEDYLKTVEENIAGFERAAPNNAFPKEISGFAAHILKNKLITPSKRIFDNSKISDHFAIIPTGKIPAGGLEEPALKLYDHVLRRFLSVFYPAAEFENTSRITRIGEDTFKTDGKVLIVPGWLEVYGRKPGVPDGKDELVPAKDGERALAIAVEVQDKQTRPPARFTESTLLSAMETAGKRVDDEALREAMSERGLGTPATRAATI
ncbi:MAG: DNA topoisomerase-3, partial [Pseudoalteromonas tetraodonis]